MTLDFILWDEWRGSLDGRPTMWISRLLKIPFWRKAGKWLSVRVDLHKFVGADDWGCFHTHPAHAFRIILKGGYVEQFPDGDMMYWHPGSFGHVKPELAHRVSALFNNMEGEPQPSYSLWFRGPICADVKLIGDGWEKKNSVASTRSNK